MTTTSTRAITAACIGIVLVATGCPGDSPNDGVVVEKVDPSFFSDVIRRESVTEYVPAGTERRSFDVDDPDEVSDVAIADWTLEASDEATMTAAAHDFVDHAVADGWTVDEPWVDADGYSVIARLSKKNLVMEVSFHPEGADGSASRREIGDNPYFVFIWIENDIDRGFDISGN